MESKVYHAWQVTMYHHPSYPLPPLEQHQHDCAVMDWSDYEALQARIRELEAELDNARWAGKVKKSLSGDDQLPGRTGN